MTTDLGPLIPGDDTAVLRHALSLNPKGWALEFGVGGGGTLRLIAEVMPVLGFDSFDGLPEDWRPGFERGMFAQPRIPSIENATLVVELFEDTLPAFDWPDEVGMFHVDCDLYSSTATVLTHAGHLIRPGTLVVFDEFFGYDGAENHEAKAWSEFCLRENLAYEAIGHGREQVAFRIIGRGEWVGS